MVKSLSNTNLVMAHPATVDRPTATTAARLPRARYSVSNTRMIWLRVPPNVLSRTPSRTRHDHAAHNAVDGALQQAEVDGADVGKTLHQYSLYPATHSRIFHPGEGNEHVRRAEQRRGLEYGKEVGFELGPVDLTDTGDPRVHG